jgi:hypothetical protein
MGQQPGHQTGLDPQHTIHPSKQTVNMFKPFLGDKQNLVSWAVLQGHSSGIENHCFLQRVPCLFQGSLFSQLHPPKHVELRSVQLDEAHRDGAKGLQPPVAAKVFEKERLGWATRQSLKGAGCGRMHAS